MIVAEDLKKSFRVTTKRTGGFSAFRALLPGSTSHVEAVRSVSFSIKASEMVAVLGPNGAGKSTTIKMLTGILVPDAGTARVLGLVPWQSRRDVAKRIGVVFGQRTQLWWDLPLSDSLDLVRHMYGVPAQRFAENLSICRELLDLDPFLDRPVRQLSLGQRMRGDLTAALIHDPEILFLDEPTIGLDLVAKARMRDALLHLNERRGVTVVLTTHDLADVARLCQRVLLIDHGRVVHDGGLEALRTQFGNVCTLVVDLAFPSASGQAPISGATETDEQRPGPLVVPGATETRSEGNRHWLAFDRRQVSASDLIASVASLYPLSDLSLEEPDIETVIANLYKARTE